MDNLPPMTEELKNIMEYTLFESGGFRIQVYNLVNILLILLIARAMLWLIRNFFKKRNSAEVDKGKVYAILQIISYLVYTIAIIVAIKSMGVDITVLLAGSTALLVGLGLGLQDFFRDLVAGFIILSERTVTAGDIVEIDGKIGQIKDVGLRTTSLLTRDDIIVIVPNTRLTTDHVINWSQSKQVTRFKVDVNVAFGSDTEQVKKILVEAAREHEDVIEVPEPYVFFRDFGSHALEFSLLFFSHNLFRIERVKSEIRFIIDRKFRENNITIPFPQQDLWFRNSPPNANKDTPL